MSIGYLVEVRCDKCGNATGGVARTPGDARDEARRQGWGGGHSGFDLCPLCVKPVMRVDQWQLPDGTVMSNKFGNPKE